MPSHACLDSLPTELKTRIAEECYRWDSTRQEPREHFPSKYLDARSLPSAVGALFQVSREWYAVAAPFRFRSLSPTQCADQTFLLNLRQKYENHLKEVNLEQAYDDDIPALFTFLSSFAGTLEDLTVPSISALSGELSQQVSGSIDRFMEDTLRRLIHKSETVTVETQAFDSLDLCIGSPIKKLSFSYSLTDGRTDFARLVAVIASCPALVELDLWQRSIYEAGEDFASAAAALATPGAMPAVQRRQLNALVGSASLHALIALFGPTLVHLDLTVACWIPAEEADALPQVLGRQFPRLATMAVRNRFLSKFPFLPPVSPETFPSLCHLFWELPQLSSEINKSALSTSLRQIATSFATSVSPLRINIFAPPVDLERARAAASIPMPPAVHLSVGLDPDNPEAIGSSWPISATHCRAANGCDTPWGRGSGRVVTAAA